MLGKRCLLSPGETHSTQPEDARKTQKMIQTLGFSSLDNMTTVSPKSLKLQQLEEHHLELVIHRVLRWMHLSVSSLPPEQHDFMGLVESFCHYKGQIDSDLVYSQLLLNFLIVQQDNLVSLNSEAHFSTGLSVFGSIFCPSAFISQDFLWVLNAVADWTRQHLSTVAVLTKEEFVSLIQPLCEVEFAFEPQLIFEQLMVRGVVRQTDERQLMGHRDQREDWRMSEGDRFLTFHLPDAEDEIFQLAEGIKFHPFYL